MEFRGLQGRSYCWRSEMAAEIGIEVRFDCVGEAHSVGAEAVETCVTADGESAWWHET